MRLVATILGILFLSVGVFGQAFDEDEPAPEKKSAPKAVVQEKKVEITVPAAPAQAAPAVPAQAAPAVPAQTVPATPVQAIPATPAQGAPVAPAQVTPSVPAQVAPAAVPAVKTEAIKKVTAQPAPSETDSTLLTETICAVTGISIKVTDKTPTSDYHGIRYYFVSDAKKTEFEKNQWKYSREILTCQVCGKQDKIKGRGRATFPDSRYEGRTYYFCCNAHKSLFEESPLKYIDADKMYLRTVLKKPETQPGKPAAAPATDTTKEK